jgi:serine/threonine protein kinase
MELRLPLPDFGVDDDSSDFWSPISSPISPQLACLTEEEYKELCQGHGLHFLCQSPIRCTSNSGVYQAISTNGVAYAAKVTSHKDRAIQEFRNRAQIQNSPFLVRTIDFYESPTKVLVLMELCPDGDIAHSQFPENIAWQLINNIGNALLVLHDSGWMHLDVSPGNILRGDGLFKLADFGTLTRIGQFEQGNEGAGPYVSREALEYPHGHPVDGQTDIFSLGIVLLEVLTGRFAPRGGFSSYGKLRDGQIRLGSKGYSCDCSVELMNLVNAMLMVNPADRPTALKLTRYSFGRGGL